MSTLAEVRAAVDSCPARWQELPDVRLVSQILALKAAAVEAGDEAGANELWCLRRVHSIHERFVDAFRQLKAAEFFRAWCTYEEIEILTAELNPHLGLLGHDYCTGWVIETTAQFQKLFPYKLFLSPAYDIVARECLLCGARMTPRTGCNHVPGRLYMGELARTRVIPGAVNHIAIVENPARKYRILYADNEQEFRFDSLRFLIDRLPSPYESWRAELTTARHPHRLFAHVGKYAPCPCDSGKKYKFCCLKHADGVLSPHMSFWFGCDVPTSLQAPVYPDHAARAAEAKQRAATRTDGPLIMKGIVARTTD